jgi:hypothetical protein
MIDLLSDVLMLVLSLYEGTEFVTLPEINKLLSGIQQRLRQKLTRTQLLAELSSQMECLVAGANNFYIDYEEPKRVEIQSM